MWLCLLTEAIFQCYQKWHEKIEISTKEEYIITKCEGALQLCFYDIFGVSLWKNWDMDIFMIPGNRQTFSSKWISKESQKFHNTSRQLNFRNELLLRGVYIEISSTTHKYQKIWFKITKTVIYSILAKLEDF